MYVYGRIVYVRFCALYMTMAAPGNASGGGTKRNALPTKGEAKHKKRRVDAVVRGLNAALDFAYKNKLTVQDPGAFWCLVKSAMVASGESLPVTKARLDHVLSAMRQQAHERIDANDTSLIFGLCDAMRPVKRATRKALAELAAMSKAEQLHCYVESPSFAQCDGGPAHTRMLAFAITRRIVLIGVRGNVSVYEACGGAPSIISEAYDAKPEDVCIAYTGGHYVALVPDH